jgi:hypothetical protein
MNEYWPNSTQMPSIKKWQKTLLLLGIRLLLALNGSSASQHGH